jgi:prepilin-type N-terminal cleavage/methylation domain-containing protein
VPKPRWAFTLIEVLVVVLIIGALAAIAIPKFGASKDKAYLATMKSDLHNLATLQESYFSDNGNAYAATVAAFGTNYRVSSGVTITLADVTSTGWSATAVHAASQRSCTLSVGNSASGASEPVCN